MTIQLLTFRDCGALGSRLTGAGWGGCCVSLVPTSQLSSFLAAMKAGYYDKEERLRAKVDQALFATQPGQGAVIYMK